VSISVCSIYIDTVGVLYAVGGRKSRKEEKKTCVRTESMESSIHQSREKTKNQDQEPSDGAKRFKWVQSCHFERG